MLRQPLDPVVDQTPNPLQELDPGIPEVVAGRIRPHLSQQRLHRPADETPGTRHASCLLFHLKPPSSPRSVPDSPASPYSATEPPSTSAVRHAAAASRSPL